LDTGSRATPPATDSVTPDQIREEAAAAMKAWHEAHPTPASPSTTQNVSIVTANRFQWYKWPFENPDNDVALDHQRELACNVEWGRYVMCKSVRNGARLLYWEGEMGPACKGTLPQFMKCWRARDKETELELYAARRQPISLDRHPWPFRPEYLALLQAKGRLKTSTPPATPAPADQSP